MNTIIIMMASLKWIVLKLTLKVLIFRKITYFKYPSLESKSLNLGNRWHFGMKFLGRRQIALWFQTERAKIMEFEWAEVKTFYFRNENVIFRVPFCFLLHLAAYFHKNVKGSDEETKTWYEMAGRYLQIAWTTRGLLFVFDNFLLWEQFTVKTIAFPCSVNCCMTQAYNVDSFLPYFAFTLVCKLTCSCIIVCDKTALNEFPTWTMDSDSIFSLRSRGQLEIAHIILFDRSIFWNARPKVQYWPILLQCMLCIEHFSTNSTDNTLGSSKGIQCYKQFRKLFGFFFFNIREI